jgi:RNA ligase (TIGR02306 family)
MAQWGVFACKLEIHPHPSADKLVLGNVNGFQIVFSISNGYKNGDTVVFAPEKSVLPDDIKGDYVNTETGVSYLSGPEHNRVKRVRLRNEYSEGVTINPAWVEKKLGLHRHEFPQNKDLSELLGITKYEPPIPMNMAGQLENIEGVSYQRQHDVEQFRLYSNEFIPGEEVIATEKIHGSQISIMRTTEGRWYVTSKGIGKSGFAIQESEDNIYWQALNNSGLRECFNHKWPSDDNPMPEVQIFGEVIPIQKGYSYGQIKPTIRVFRVLLNGQEYTKDFIKLESSFLHNLTSFYITVVDLWVPILYKGPYSINKMVDLSSGSEQVSGKETHIREGIVVSPIKPRKSKEGFLLMLKIINHKFKDTDEHFS